MSASPADLIEALRQTDPEEAAHLQDLLEEAERTSPLLESARLGRTAMKDSNAKKPRKSHTVIVDKHPGDTDAEAFARGELQPSMQAALTLMNWGPVLPCEQDCNALVKELQKQATAATGNDLSRMEAMLAIQAHTLDAMFNDMSRRAKLNMGDYPEAFERYMRLAFKAQSQCRANIEALAEIKSPKAVAFVQQANISSGPQQVNNAARGKETPNPSNELLEQQNERLDTRSQIAAIPSDPVLATMGAVDRPTVVAGQGTVEAQQSQARRVQHGVQGTDGPAEETQRVT